MTDEQKALSRRAVACKHWRWMPGMLAFDAGGNQHRVIEHDEGREYVTTMLRDYNDAHCESSARAVDLTPVLDDPATMGCLLYLVREAWPDEWTDYAVPVHDGFGGWTFGVITRNAGPGQVNVTTVFASSVFPWHPSEAEALVAALEAAP